MNDQQSRGGQAVTNPEVARVLGLSESGVHRIRNGSRYPSLDVMRRVETTYGWPLAEQLNLIPPGPSATRRNMDYANELERRINAKK